MSDTSRAAPPIAGVALPQPRKSGGKPLFDALSERRSSREFRPDGLDARTLSELLWAAFGVNREHGFRTAPSAHDWREIDIYLALPDALYVYDPGAHALAPVIAQDLRAATGLQDFVATAPLNLVYVADFARVDSQDRAEQRFYAAADAGLIAQNVYLFCASEGLATVVRGLIDRPTLAMAMRLRPEQRVILAQTVGRPV
ncbi:SagB/ThcOx family dehydrogenase [Methylocapsa polymorpha]|uniref:SagB/ThcOx family dehydrogenase n=1 Tax=Methylocapsa polymorpha TaxID=3080828 RepID=A0ABZ0HVW7_9HYPH|nr:SagB/ThcOx family dehydrogenase [Methylocapsa sp. RX1]